MADLIIDGTSIISKTGSTVTYNAGTIGDNIAFPTGHVVQIVTFTSTTGTNVTSTSETPIASSKKAITLKTNNPLIIYNAVLGYESDTSGSFNMFFDLRYSSDDTTYTAIDSTTRMNGSVVDDSLGTGSTTIVTHHVMSDLYNAGDTVYYQLYYKQHTSASVYFNQQSLGGQPSGTSNMSSGCIMEIMR